MDDVRRMKDDLRQLKDAQRADMQDIRGMLTKVLDGRKPSAATDSSPQASWQDARLSC